MIRVTSITYGDFDGAGVDEAAVHLNYSTGGTSNWDFLYLYRLRGNAPKLVAILQSGSRGYGGLVRVSIANGLLVLDFADAERREGDCCSNGYVRVRFRRQHGEFNEEDRRERGDLDSRIQ
jgi:hypothetical protein